MAGSLEKEIKIKLTIDGKDANTTLQLSGNLYDKLIQKTNNYQEQAAGAGSTTRGFTSETTAMNQALVHFGSIIGDSDIFLNDFKGGIDLIADKLPLLIQSFSNAGKEAGTLGTTVGKQLVASLTGMGGLSLALSGISLLLKVLPELFSDSTKEVKKQKEEIKELRNEYAKFTEQEIKKYLLALEKQKSEIEIKHPKTKGGIYNTETGEKIAEVELTLEERLGSDYHAYQNIEKRIKALKLEIQELGEKEKLERQIAQWEEKKNNLSRERYDKDTKVKKNNYWEDEVPGAKSFEDAVRIINSWINLKKKAIGIYYEQEKNYKITNEKSNTSINKPSPKIDIPSIGVDNLNIDSQIEKIKRLQIVRVNDELYYVDIAKECEEDLAQERNKRINEIINNTGKLLSTLGEAYNKYYSSLESNTKKEIDDWQKNEKKKLDNERKAALSHARTSKQKERINEEYNRREQELENQAKVRLKEKLEVWFAWQKAASIAQATINTYEGATKALAQGGVFGALMAGAVIAAGLANIAVIASQKMPGYKKGGAIVGEDGPEIIAPFQDYASGQSKLITMTMMTLRDEIRSSPVNYPKGDFRKLEEAIVRLNKRLDEGIDARAYLDDKQAKRIVNRGSAMSRKSKI